MPLTPSTLFVVLLPLAQRVQAQVAADTLSERVVESVYDAINHRVGIPRCGHGGSPGGLARWLGRPFSLLLSDSSRGDHGYCATSLPLARAGAPRGIHARLQ